MLSRRNYLTGGTVKISTIQDKSTLYVSALLASGFRLIPGDEYYFTLEPCPAGTFCNSSSKGHQGCIECPPGRFRSRRNYEKN